MKLKKKFDFTKEYNIIIKELDDLERYIINNKKHDISSNKHK
jgi:hypothetical protein